MSYPLLELNQKDRLQVLRKLNLRCLYHLRQTSKTVNSFVERNKTRIDCPCDFDLWIEEESFDLRFNPDPRYQNRLTFITKPTPKIGSYKRRAPRLHEDPVSQLPSASFARILVRVGSLNVLERDLPKNLRMSCTDLLIQDSPDFERIWQILEPHLGSCQNLQILNYEKR